MRPRTASIAALALAAALAGALRVANALDYPDMLGNWCSATARLEFSRDAMGVLIFATKSHTSSRVTRYDFTGSLVTVHWERDDGQMTTSVFGEFAADGRTMFLQPAQSVPRREYKRC